LDLAPEQPWRCPANCASYEPTAIDATFTQGSLARPAVEEEPDETPEAIEDLLDDAEQIIDEAEPEVLRELDAGQPSVSRKWWRPWKRGRRRDGGDDWHLSSR
jgi:hypothetical protein